MSIRPLRRRMRCLQIEDLESRWTLTSHPMVLDVNIDSTEWSSYFTYHLETHYLGNDGYSVLYNYSAPRSSWNNVDQLHIQFNQNVNVDAWDLTLTGVNTTYEFADFSYDPYSLTATWTLDAPLPADSIQLDLNGDGLDPVTNSSGYPLYGGDFELEFSSVPGDVDYSNEVTSNDAQLVQNVLGQGVGSSNYDPIRDIDGSGFTDGTDYSLTQSLAGDSLPNETPLGALGDAPSTSGIANLQVDEDAANYTIALDAVFADEEDPVGDLTYSVIDNTNPNLFESLGINQSSGNLTLDFGDDQFGSSELTIRAMDTAGMFIDVPFQVDVNSVNDAPWCELVSASYDWVNDRWEIDGRVLDIDGDLTRPDALVSVDNLPIVADTDDDGVFHFYLPTGYSESSVTISYADEFGLTFEVEVTLNLI